MSFKRIAIIIKKVFMMVTSSITKNLIISRESHVEIFTDAIESSVSYHSPHVQASANCS